MGYYLIVTDTQGTERCFFDGLHDELPPDIRNRIVIKVVETKTRTLARCLQYRIRGYVAVILDESMKIKLGRSLPKKMSRCTGESVRMVMSRRQTISGYRKDDACAAIGDGR